MLVYGNFSNASTMEVHVLIKARSMSEYGNTGTV